MSAIVNPFEDMNLPEDSIRIVQLEEKKSNIQHSGESACKNLHKL